MRGVELFELMSQKLGLHLLASDYQNAPGIRSITRRDARTVVELQGTITFPSAELILHELEDVEMGEAGLIVDLSRVSGFNNAGRRL